MQMLNEKSELTRSGRLLLTLIDRGLSAINAAKTIDEVEVMFPGNGEAVEVEDDGLCECGCGDEVTPGRRFIHSHYSTQQRNIRLLRGGETTLQGLLASTTGERAKAAYRAAGE